MAARFHNYNWQREDVGKLVVGIPLIATLQPPVVALPATSSSTSSSPLVLRCRFEAPVARFVPQG